MKRSNEYNNYSVNNPDGHFKPQKNDGKTSFYNDNPHSVNELPSRDVKESSSYREKYEFSENETANATSSAKKESAKASEGAKSVLRNALSTMSTGGAVAVGGAVASAVATAVIVVVYVAVALSVSVSLFAATHHSLTFLLNIQNDEQKPLVAVLEEGDVFLTEREILNESYLTFDDLKENTEYFLTIKDKETDETYFRQSFFTLSTDERVAEIPSAFFEEDRLVFFVEFFKLNQTDFYTVSATDARGNTLFTSDETERTKEFSFAVSPDLNEAVLSVRLHNAVVAYLRVEKEPLEPTEPENPDPPVPDEPSEPEEPAASYDYANMFWEWNETANGYEAFAVVPNLSDKDDFLRIAASVSEENVLSPSCEENGEIVYLATMTAENKETYSDEKTVVLPALGHSYGTLIAAVPASCEETGMKAHYICSECNKIFDEEENETSADDLVLPALGHSYGTLIAAVPASCEETGMKAHYICSECNKIFDKEENETTADDLVLAALGHSYGTLIAAVPASCEETGVKAHYICSECNKIFDEEENETTADDLVLAALGHNYVDPTFTWEETVDGSGYTAKAKYVCSHDATHTKEVDAEVSREETPSTCVANGLILYTATAESDTATKSIELPLADHTPGELVFPDELDLASINILTGEPTTPFAATTSCSVCGEEMSLDCEYEFILQENGAAYTLTCGEETQDYIVYYEYNSATFTYDTEAETFTLTSVPSPASSSTGSSEAAFAVPDALFGKPVTVIAQATFASTAYSSVTLPSSLVTIEDEAFADCTSLTSVTFPTSLQTIGANAFTGCSSLVSVTIPSATYSSSGVTSIGKGAFSACTSLESMTLPVGIVEWFGYIVGSTSVMTDSAETGVPYDNGDNETYYIPESLTTLTLKSGTKGTSGTVGRNEFRGIPTLTTIVFDSIKEISSHAFAECYSLTSVTFDSSLRKLGDNLFQGCSELTELTVPSYVQSVSAGAFSGMSSLESITLPFVGAMKTNEYKTPTISSLSLTDESMLLFGYVFEESASGGAQGFYNVSQSASSNSTHTYLIPETLTSVTIQGGCVFRGAFMNANTLESVALTNVSYVETVAFDGVSALTSLTVDGATWQVYDANGATIKSYDGTTAANAATMADNVLLDARSAYVWRKY